MLKYSCKYIHSRVQCRVATTLHFSGWGKVYKNVASGLREETAMLSPGQENKDWTKTGSWCHWDDDDFIWPYFELMQTLPPYDLKGITLSWLLLHVSQHLTQLQWRVPHCLLNTESVLLCLETEKYVHGSFKLCPTFPLLATALLLLNKSMNYSRQGQ